jgi:molybdenum cofactor cytidylyltransferase
LDGWTALILAGGAGRRFGGGKLLADLAGAPVIQRVVQRVARAGFADVLVITGVDDAGVRAALSGVTCRILPASSWTEGVAATLREGMAALEPEAKGVCIFLGDMPLVPVALCVKLAEAAERTGYAARPRHDGQPGHPVAFTRAAFADLMALEGDKGATALFARRPEAVAYLDTADTGALLDIDTPEDLAFAEQAWKSCATSATSESATSRGPFPKP